MSDNQGKSKWTQLNPVDWAEPPDASRVLYDAVAEIWLPKRDDLKVRITLPDGSEDVVDMADVPTYEDLLTYIRAHYHRGGRCIYLWSAVDRAGRIYAQRRILFEDDRVVRTPGVPLVAGSEAHQRLVDVEHEVAKLCGAADKPEEP
jgi:hypothetical protein